MSDIAQWIIVGIAVAAAAVYLVKRLKPSKNGCCSGCPYAGSCSSARSDLTECSDPRDNQLQRLPR